MFLKFDDQYSDGELGSLCELLELLDLKLSDVHNNISDSIDPDSEGLLDKGEYFIGVGFVAMQQYMIETLLFTGVDKGKAYSLGPVHSSNMPYASLINAAANWWKHEAEWWNAGEIAENNRTYSKISLVADSNEYQLSNVLASICSSSGFSLMGVVPILIEWRKSVDEARSLR